MQPLQYDLRYPAAQESSITHAAAVPSNLDAAITMRFAASRRTLARIYAHGKIRGRQSCSHSNAICNHRFKKREELRTQERPLVAKTHRRNQLRPERPQPQPHPPHTRGTFHRRLQPLYTEKCKVSCSGFLPKTWPMQHSCSHSNAICNHSFKKRIKLRTQELHSLPNT